MLLLCFDYRSKLKDECWFQRQIWSLWLKGFAVKDTWLNPEVVNAPHISGKKKSDLWFHILGKSRCLLLYLLITPHFQCKTMYCEKKRPPNSCLCSGWSKSCGNLDCFEVNNDCSKWWCKFHFLGPTNTQIEKVSFHWILTNPKKSLNMIVTRWHVVYWPYIWDWISEVSEFSLNYA